MHCMIYFYFHLQLVWNNDDNDYSRILPLTRKRKDRCCAKPCLVRCRRLHKCRARRPCASASYTTAAPFFHQSLTFLLWHRNVELNFTFYSDRHFENVAGRWPKTQTENWKYKKFKLDSTWVIPKWLWHFFTLRALRHSMETMTNKTIHEVHDEWQSDQKMTIMIWGVTAESSLTFCGTCSLREYE